MSAIERMACIKYILFLPSVLSATEKMSSLRPQVLSMYRRLIRLSQTWTSKAADQTMVERDYIKEETRKLFKANSSLTAEKDISDRVSRLRKRIVFMHVLLHIQYCIFILCRDSGNFVFLPRPKSQNSLLERKSNTVSQCSLFDKYA